MVNNSHVRYDQVMHRYRQYISDLILYTVSVVFAGSQQLRRLSKNPLPLHTAARWC